MTVFCFVHKLVPLSMQASLYSQSSIFTVNYLRKEPVTITQFRAKSSLFNRISEINGDYFARVIREVSL